MQRCLIVVAVAAEARAIISALGTPESVRLGPYSAERIRTSQSEISVVAGGIGPAAAASATATALMAEPAFDTVISAGIGGGFEAAGAKIGDVVVATKICFADLGAHSPEKFLDAAALGWTGASFACSAAAAKELGRRIAFRGLRVHLGTIVTVAAATGTAARAADLTLAHNAVAEGMEGAGVAHAAILFGKPVLEFRAVSNAVGERNVAAWDIPRALKVLELAAESLREFSA